MTSSFPVSEKLHSGFARYRYRWFGWLLAALIVTVIATQETYNTRSDPRGTLLVSQALAQHGTLKLDAYGKPLLDSYGYVIQHKAGHFYHYFPLGTALLSSPFVAVANALGFDMTRDEHLVQMALTALAALLIAFILYRTARLYLPRTPSLLLTGLCWFGSSLASTVGTALWSHDFALVFSSAAIFLLLSRPVQTPGSATQVAAQKPVSRPLKNVGEAGKTRQKRPKKRSLRAVNEHFEAVFNAVLPTQVVFQRPVSRRSPEPLRPLRPLLIGACLFLAYLCRPTLALLAPFLLLYYFIQDRKSSLLAALTLGLLLLAFMGWSIGEFAQILPDYYLPKRLEGGEFATALYANLLSPARGLLIFSPFIAVSLLLTLVLAVRNKALLSLSLISLAWPTAHLLSISQFPHWWAGWSFGPRLMVDALPGLYVGLFSALGALRQRRRLAYAALLGSGLLAIHINTYQALFNPYGMHWNVEPNVDLYPEYLFDWRYPQFLHNQARHEQRLSEFYSQQLPKVTGLINVSYDSEQAAFDGFFELEPGFRWSEGHAAKLHLVLDEQTQQALRGEIELLAGFLDKQRLLIGLNGEQVYSGKFYGGEREIRFQVPPELFRTGLNTFTFQLPDAHKPASADPRILAMAFRKLSIR